MIVLYIFVKYIVHYTYIVYIAIDGCLLCCAINCIDITYTTTNETISTPIVFHVKEYYDGDNKCTLGFWSDCDDNDYSSMLYEQVEANIYDRYHDHDIAK